MSDGKIVAMAIASLGFSGLAGALAVVGLFDGQGWADPTTIWTALGSLATVAAAVVAIWTLVALKQDSADRTRPVVIAELNYAVLSDHAELLVRNVGPSVARNVRVDFVPPLPDPEDGGSEAEVGVLTPFLQRRYSRVIPTLAPGMRLSNFYQDAEGSEEPVPDDFTVTISYSDDRGRKYVDSFELSMFTLRDQTVSRPSNSDPAGIQRRWVSALEAIARGVGRY
jgi:hypothetical protein